MTLEVHSPESLKRAKILVYGVPGAGKTHLLGSAQEDERTYPCCYCDWEAGTESLSGLDVDIFPMRSWNDINEVLEYLEHGDTVKLNGQTVDFSEYRSVAVDSVSELNRWAQLDLLKREAKQRKDSDLLEYKDYNRTSVQMRRTLRRFRDLPMHVFLSAHARQIDEPRLGRMMVPELTGQLSEEIGGLMSVVGYLGMSENEDGDSERILLLHDYPKYRCKVRTPWRVKVPNEIIEPDISEILDVLGYQN